MKRRILPLFVFGVVCLAGLAIGADEPKADDGDAPVRLKKKNKQPAPAEQPKDDKLKDDKSKDDKLKDDKAKDDMPKDVEAGPGAQEDEKEVLERIARNMKAVEDRFINKELNEGTRQLKDDIIKDIDSLIKMAENPPPSGGGSGNPGSGNSGGSGSQSQSEQQPMNQGGMEKGGRNPMQGGREGSKEGMGTTGKGVTSDAEPPKPPNNGDDERGKWGHLPESLRAQMNVYATKEEYMAKHQELIKEYYRNLARQGGKK